MVNENVENLKKLSHIRDFVNNINVSYLSNICDLTKDGQCPINEADICIKHFVNFLRNSYAELTKELNEKY